MLLDLMPSIPRVRRVPARVAAAALTALIASAAALVLAPPASAHDEIVSASPADGATLDSAPAEVVLTFSDDVIELGTAVAVTDSTGAALADGPLSVDGAVLTQKILPPTAPGAVRVAYRVVSADGHPVSGTYTFTVTSAPSTTPAAPDSSPAPASSTPPSPVGSASATDDVAAASGTSSAAAPAAADSGSALPWVIAVVVLVLVALAGAALGRRGRSGSGS